MPGPGDFGVVRMRGWRGFLIRLGQWLNGGGFRNFEHAFVMVDETTMVEGEPGGAKLAPLSKYLDRPIAWYKAPPNAGLGIAAAARTLVRTPYSFLDYFALAAHRLHLPFNWLLKDYVASTGHMICSQLVDRAYQLAGVQLFNDGRWPGYVTPADLERLAREQVA